MTQHFTDKLTALQCYLEVADHAEHAQNELQQLRNKLDSWNKTKRDAEDYLSKVIGKQGSVSHKGRMYFLNDHGRLASRETDTNQGNLDLAQKETPAEAGVDVEYEYPSCANCGHVFYEQIPVPVYESRCSSCSRCR